VGAPARTRRPVSPSSDGSSPADVPDLMDEAEFQALYADRVAVPAPTASPPPPSVRPERSAAASKSGDAPPPSVRPERSAAASKGEGATPPPDPFGGAFVTSDEVLAALQSEARAAAPAPERAPLPLAPAPAADVAAPLSFGAAVGLLAGVADRGEIARIVLRFARSRFRRALLLTVHGRGADGWEGIGDGLTPQTVARVHVSLEGPGVVRTVVETRSHVLGPLQKTDANVALLRALAGGAPKSAFAMPILARGQVVNVLYADGGRGGHVNPDGVGELLILAAKIAQTYDALLARAR
jgi:hypothetical protein